MKTADLLLPDQRHLFDIPDDVAYLNCAYQSPLMNSVVAAGEAAVRQKQYPWEITPPRFFHPAGPWSRTVCTDYWRKCR